MRYDIQGNEFNQLKKKKNPSYGPMEISMDFLKNLSSSKKKKKKTT